MKLTENVLKQTIREVISELLKEDSRSDGGFEEMPAPPEDELIPIDPPKFPPTKKVTPPKITKKRRTVLPDPSKPSKDNNTKVANPKKKVKEGAVAGDENGLSAEEMAAGAGEGHNFQYKVTKAIDKAIKPKPMKRGNFYDHAVSRARQDGAMKKEGIDEVSGVPVAKDDDFDPFEASKSLSDVAGVDNVREELDPVGKEDGDIDNDGDKDSSDRYLMKRRKAIGNNMKGDVSEQEMPELPKPPKTPEVKPPEVKPAEVEPPGTADATPNPVPMTPPGQQTNTPMSFKEQVSAKHNRIFESLVKSVTKK